MGLVMDDESLHGPEMRGITKEDQGNVFICVLRAVLNGSSMLLVDIIEQDSLNQTKLTGTIAHPSCRLH